MTRRRGVTVLPLLWFAFAATVAMSGGHALAQELDSPLLLHDAPSQAWTFTNVE